MVRRGGYEIWAIVQAERSWATQVWEDLAWMKQWSGVEIPLLHHANWPEWWRLLAASTGTFKNRAKAAAKNLLKAERGRWAVQLFYRDLLKDAGGATNDRGKQAEDKWVCPPCAMAFHGKAALSVHFQRKPGKCAAYSNYVVGSLCQACGLELSSQRRLLLRVLWCIGCHGTWSGAASTENQKLEAGHGGAFRAMSANKNPPASDTVPCLDRKWRDNPQMDTAFWNLLDWIIYENPQTLEPFGVELLKDFESLRFLLMSFALS